MRQFFIKHFFVLFLLFICLLVISANYTPGTFLSGWDTLHPEFNRLEYLKRIVFGVWQKHQGVGTLATQAHASEIPRMILYIPMSFILPLSLVRYSYFFLTIFLGPLGMYFLIRKIFGQKDSIKTKMAATLGSLLYLLNLATVQQFFVPLEMFATHFAATPWLFFFAISYLQKQRKKSLLFFALTTFFAAPMAHTATLWYVYFCAFTLFLLTYSLLYHQKTTTIRALILIGITLSVNVFWLLPNLYFAITSGHAIEVSKIHQLFTEEAFAQNAAYGTLPDLALFKNFLFNWGAYVGNNSFAPLLETWSTHLKNPFVQGIGYFFFVFALLGFAWEIKKKNRSAIAFFSIFLLSVFFWLNNNPPLGFVFSYLQQTIPLFKEVFRFPFTKFSLLLVLTTSIFFAYAVGLIIEFVEEKKQKTLLLSVLFVILASALLFYSYPAFKGNFISPLMRVKVPNEYFRLFGWFNHQDPNGKVANLPIHSFWGWTYYNFGYQGAGFLWFGIKQPLLDREFDRWSPYNEQYFREMSHAIYTQNTQLLEQIIKKYDIAYIIFDQNVIAPGQAPDVLFKDKTKKLLAKSTLLKKTKQFGNISIYKTTQSPLLYQPVYVITPSLSTQKTPAVYEDFLYTTYGNYIGETKQLTNYYPFRDVMNNQNQIKPTVTEFTQEGVVITPLNLETPLILGNYLSAEEKIPAQLMVEKSNENTITISLIPQTPLASPTKLPHPIVTEAKLPQTKDGKFIISVNNNQNILVQNLPTQTPIALGNISLNTKEENVISLYDNTPDRIYIPDFADIAPDEFLCGKPSQKQLFGLVISPEGDGFSLYGKHAIICMVIPLSKIYKDSPKSLTPLTFLAPQILLSADFSYTGGTFSNLCIADLKTGSCLNYLSKDISFSHSYSAQSFSSLGVSEKDIPNLALKIFFDTTNISTENPQVSYANFSFGKTLPFFEKSFGQGVLSSSLSPISPNTPTSPTLLIIPYSGREELNKDVTTLPKTDGHCEPNPFTGLANKKIVKREEKDHFIRYISEDGSLCDNFSYPNLSQEQGYIIAITSRNIEGLPIRLCTANYLSKRCDLYTTLSKSKEPITDVFLIPPMAPQDNQSTRKEILGFDVNINNFGIKRRPSINDIISIQIIPFPYAWLSQIYSGKITNPSFEKTNLANVQSINPSLYLASLPPTTPYFPNFPHRPNTVVLSQAYNSGWHAYVVPKNNPLTGISPFLFGQELKDHVLVNNWANGWIVPNSQLSTLNSQLVIVYLPQYLEYMGFILLIIIFAILLLPNFPNFPYFPYRHLDRERKPVV